MSTDSLGLNDFLYSFGLGAFWRSSVISVRLYALDREQSKMLKFPI